MEDKKTNSSSSRNDFGLSTNAPSPPRYPSPPSQSTTRIVNRLQSQRILGQYFCPFHGHHAALEIGTSSGGETSSIALQSTAESQRRILFEEIKSMSAAFRRDACIVRFEQVADEDEKEDESEDEDEDEDQFDNMRLSIDEMTYEELLELGEENGHVSTGLTEETILAHLGRQRHEPISTESSRDNDLCPICQDEFKDGEEVGKLECGHGCHFECIKKWLARKNICPICKSKALFI